MILNFKNKKDKNLEKFDLLKIVCLLIHAAKIDENYTENEKKIILDFIIAFSKHERITNENVKEINFEQANSLVKEAEVYENNSNHILEYTREVKKMDIELKTLILEAIWQIVLSDDKSGIYESSLIRRICGLLYIPDKLSGDIKMNLLKRKKL